MFYRVATVFLLIIGFSSRTSFAQSTCPTVTPESLAASGQSLSLLLVGNVHVDAHPRVTVAVSPAGRASVNVRALPSAQSALAGSIPAGGSLSADGRLSDATWLHVQLANGGDGWVSASVVKVDGDVNSLATRSSDQAAAPSSAGFDLTSSPDTNCPDAPNGVLLQTPDGTDTLILNVNGVILDLNQATVFITNDDQGLGIAVLEGTVLLQSTSQVTSIEAGTETHLARSADGRLAGQPSAPAPLAPAEIAQLPVAQLGSVIATTPEPTEEIASTETASATVNYQFAIDKSAPPTCVSGELSAAEVT